METKTWINITLGLTILASILQMVGFVAPMWIWIEVDSYLAGVGLWYASGCGIDGTCNVTAPPVAYNYTPENTFRNPAFHAVQALETLGTAGGVLVLLFMILYKMGYSKWIYLHYLHLLVFITCILTWLCVLTGVIVFCAAYWPVVGTSPLLSSRSFPWSLLLCLFAGVLFIFVSVFNRLKCWDSDFVKHAIPISGDAQMDLHPVTKQGFWHRYFTPAYHETRRPNYAVSMQNEGVGVGGANRLLMNGGGERGAMPAIDNMAFEGNALESFNYRYLPPATSMEPIPRPHTDSIVRQSTTSPTFEDVRASYLSRYRQDATPTDRRSVAAKPPITTRGEPRGVTTRQMADYYDGGPVTREETYNTRYVTTSRQNFVPPVSAQMEGQYVSRIDVSAPPAFSAPKTYVAGLTDSAPRDVILTNSMTDSPYVTNDGRLTAGADYLATEYRRVDRGASQAGSTYGAGALQYATHLGPLGPGPRSVTSRAGGSTPFQPTYIYRPTSQQMY
ncbi:hypothetical protein ACOMHN_062198 [Nucella lapillus]